jgi:hypothetical protein
VIGDSDAIRQWLDERAASKESDMIRHDCNCAEGRMMEPDANTKPHHRHAIEKLPRDTTGKIVAPPTHDCAYVNARNRLIPVAERNVMEGIRREVGATMGRKYGGAWDGDKRHVEEYGREVEALTGRVFGSRFMVEMDRLWKERERPGLAEVGTH